ncbi:hypothetical protein [Nocardia cyriacigeorgica]|uniref:hypothetical protein n=1 Tax=Nocardia cyriacigeorgica TaxID=135487 RepID=UPI00248F5C9F|nr:hypothetical protein [Nocardia cyriacigeorgica]BDU09238.1 hypothetical protein FMUBM48_55010 [Nocardia cyriacigeorgica]
MNSGTENDPERFVDTAAEGVVVAVFSWGIVVDLGLPHPGFIDPLYIDDGDSYEAGDSVSGTILAYIPESRQFRLLPVGKVPVADRMKWLKDIRDDVARMVAGGASLMETLDFVDKNWPSPMTPQLFGWIVSASVNRPLARLSELEIPDPDTASTGTISQCENTWREIIRDACLS